MPGFAFVATLRRQVTFGVALVIAVLMAVYVMDLTLRQRSALLERETATATGLARSLATSAAGWLAARDIAGLQELVDAQNHFPQLRFAMLLDRQGRVLAHTDRARVGQFVRDLPAQVRTVTLAQGQDLTDVVTPVHLGGQAIGWARVGLDLRSTSAELAEITRNGLLYAAAAILAGAFVAALVSARLTRRLAVIQGVADAVEGGDLARRAALGGSDEAAHLARAFDQMLDALAATQSAVAESEQRLRLALNAASMVAWRWDLASDRITWIEDPQGLLGPRPAEDYPDLRALVEPQDQAAFLAAGRAAQRRGDDYRVEFRLRRTDGELRWLLARGRVERDRDGRAVSMQGIGQDITERKAMEAELIRHRDHLEELVSARTAELTAARVEAERLTRVKSEFLANMSHEIRTPLNAVLGLAQVGSRATAEAAARQAFERIAEAGGHLLAVVSDILDFSRLDAGKFVVERGPFALAEAVRNAADFVALAAQNKGIAFEVKIAPDLPEAVVGDARRLQQILTNLLANAVKFTDHGEVRLQVFRQGEDIAFRVTDTGIGMGAEQLARLFQPFEQADSSTTRRYGGSGLGLAISLNLAHLMNGHISVDSRPGEGSSFTLRLPLPAAEGAFAARAALPVASTGPRLAGLKVLAAEDVEVNRMVLEAMLALEGAHVVFGENGQQALERLREAGADAFDVVLMDVQMPVMDGLEATRQLHRLAPNLPVIGLTAHALDDERNKCLAAGMVERITKPVNVDDLVAVVLRHAARPSVVA